MTVLITLTQVGSDVGPHFNLYSNTGQGGSFVGIYQMQGVTRQQFDGVPITVPDFTTEIRVQSVGVCDNYDDIDVVPTTTTTTSSSSTTTTTTAAPSYYTYYITNSNNEGCGNEVGSTPYYAAEGAPNAVSKFFTNTSLITAWEPGAGTIGWSTTTGPITLASFGGDIDISGNITNISPCV